MNLSDLRAMVRRGDLSAAAVGYLLDCRAECEWLDYKQMLALESDHGLASFVRDVLAMANTGGGYLVIGVEDKTWRPVGLDAELPYDSKLLRDKVHRGCGVDVEVDIVHHVIVRDGVPRRLAVILVRGRGPGDGQRTPLLVRTDFAAREKYGLRRGDIFARQGDSTVRVDSAEMLHRLLRQIPRRDTPLRRSAVRAVAVLAAGAAAVSLTAFYLNRDTGGSTVPLTVTVEVFDPVCGSDWIIPRPAQPADLPTDQAGNWSDVAAARGGAAASPAWVLLFVQGRGDAEVLITDLVVRVAQRRPAIRGGILQLQCGDQGAYRFLEADLDRDPPRIGSHYTVGMAEAGDSPWMFTPIRFPYEVTLSDAEAFSIESVAEQCDCDWYVELHWASAGRTGVLHIDNNGRPFRTTGRIGAVDPGTGIR